MLVSNNFITVLDCSLFYRLRYFFFYYITLKKVFSAEKLNLTWNKQTNFNKPCCLSPPHQKKSMEDFESPEVVESLQSPQGPISPNVPYLSGGEEDSM